MKRILIALILLQGMVLCGFAGVQLEEVTTELADQSTSRVLIWIQDGEMRVEDSEEPLVFLFSANDHVFRMVDPGNSVVTQVSLAELKDMAHGMQAALGEDAMAGAAGVDMEAMMAEIRSSLSPEEQALMDQYAPQATDLDSGASDPLNWSLVARGVTLDDWSCHHYRGTQEGVLEEETWTVSAEAVGLSAKDVAAFKSLAEYMTELGGELEQVHDLDDPSAIDTYTGFPVKTVEYQYGQAVRSTRTNVLERGQLDASLFKVPAGFRTVGFQEMLMDQMELE